LRAGRDDIRGGGGNDTLNGADGKDKVSGGAGNDKLFGSDDADRVSGGAGDDGIAAGGGDDRIFGNSGNDKISPGSGGGAGKDTISGGSGNDRIDVRERRPLASEPRDVVPRSAVGQAREEAVLAPASPVLALLASRSVQYPIPVVRCAPRRRADTPDIGAHGLYACSGTIAEAVRRAYA